LEALKNVAVFNNKVVSLSPYRKAVPPGKRYQYCLRVGNYPQIKLYVSSDFLYNDAKEAHLAAERECDRRGFDQMKATIFTMKRNQR